jgi:tRNA 2-thiouridine synthesizing protein E
MNDVKHREEIDLRAVMSRLDALSRDVAEIVERQRRTEELFTEMGPILKDGMAAATARLDELEKKGYFAFGRELLRVGERVVEGFTPADVQKLGDAIVAILETLRAMTQPEVLRMAGEAASAVERADDVAPIGMMGVLKASREDDVQQGMAVTMEIMRHVGRVARSMKAQREASPEADRRRRLAAAIGPRRKTAHLLQTPQTQAPQAAAPAVQVARAPAAAVVLDGVALGADGHLVDPRAWTEELASKLAAAQGIALDDPRWALVRTARADFEAKGASPNIRRLTQLAGVPTKDIYALFPKAPGRTIAKIAGIPKPAGCI